MKEQLQNRSVPVKDWEEAQKAMRLFEKAGFEKDRIASDRYWWDYYYNEGEMTILSFNNLIQIANHREISFYSKQLTLSELRDMVEIKQEHSYLRGTLREEITSLTVSVDHDRPIDEAIEILEELKEFGFTSVKFEDGEIIAEK